MLCRDQETGYQETGYQVLETIKRNNHATQILAERSYRHVSASKVMSVDNSLRRNRYSSPVGAVSLAVEPIAVPGPESIKRVLVARVWQRFLASPRLPATQYSAKRQNTYTKSYSVQNEELPCNRRVGFRGLRYSGPRG
jgi:hypothetical protein